MRDIGPFELDVDGHRVEARLTRFSAPEDNPPGSGRQPRWMLRLDGGPVQGGPLTWDVSLDPDTEREAIAEFVRERKRVSAAQRQSH